MRYVPPIWMEDWKASLQASTSSKISEEVEMELYEKRNALLIDCTTSLHRQGAQFLLGTDTPNPFVVPGFSIHKELRNLVSAGFSPCEALRSRSCGRCKVS